MLTLAFQTDFQVCVWQTCPIYTLGQIPPEKKTTCILSISALILERFVSQAAHWYHSICDDDS